MQKLESFKNYLMVASIVLVVIFAACSKKNDSNTGIIKGTNEVWIQSSAFNPTPLTVPVNTSVKWTNMDAMTHTVTSDSTMFDSGNLSANGTYSFTFTSKGTFKYHCNIHSFMKGTIVVQ